MNLPEHVDLDALTRRLHASTELVRIHQGTADGPLDLEWSWDAPPIGVHPRAALPSRFKPRITRIPADHHSTAPRPRA